MTEIQVDITALEKQYTLATFAGMNICLTGFLDRRIGMLVRRTCAELT